HLKSLVPDYNNSSEKFVNKMTQFADGKTEVRMLDYFHRVTLDVIGKVAFDMDLNSIEDDHTPFLSAVSNCLKGLMFKLRNPLYKINPWTYDFQREVANSVKLLRETGRQCIEKRRQAIPSGQTVPDDILSTMMKLLDVDSLDITDEELLDDFVTFFIAGPQRNFKALSAIVRATTNDDDIVLNGHVILPNTNLMLGIRLQVNLWKSTREVLEWYREIPNKSEGSFINFDIVEFYPSITERLLIKAIDFAKQHTIVTEHEKDVIIHTKRTIVFSNRDPWEKKESSTGFDVTMGSYDGAESCELVVCYMLSLLQTKHGAAIGLYRDDGLVFFKEPPREMEKIKKSICKIFKENELSITIEANKK
ncbi:hypothetical protein QZH41_009918, partial [Actinostola sp. cb2023]